MSGTSLDGLDMVYVVFREHDGKWQYEIEKADTKSYDPEWKESLKMSFYQTGEALTALDAEYGRYLGQKVKGPGISREKQGRGQFSQQLLTSPPGLV